MNQITRHFTSLSELLNQATNGEPNEMLRHCDLSSRKENNPEFTGTYRYEDALDLARNGWPAGRDMIEQHTRTYKEIWSKFFPTQDFGQDLTSSVSGSIPMVSDYLLGLPESMLEFTPNEEESNLKGCKLQRIILNGGANCSILPEVIHQYGGLIGALINSMELSGFNVELVICWQNGDSFAGVGVPSPSDTIRARYSLEIKQFNQKLDIDKLAFCLSHPSMLRRFIFALREQENDEYVEKIVQRSYGYSNNLTQDEIIRFGATAHGGQLKHGNMYFRLIEANYTLDQLAEQCTAVVKEHFTEVNFNQAQNQDPNQPSQIGPESN